MRQTWADLAVLHWPVWLVVASAGVHRVGDGRLLWDGRELYLETASAIDVGDADLSVVRLHDSAGDGQS
jgi:hypothetical protein